MEDESNIQLAYATHEDIAACCPTETVLAVRVNLVFHTSRSCHKYEPHVQWTLSCKLCSGSWPLILSFNSFLKGPLRNPAWGAKTGGGNRGTKKIPDSSQSLCLKSPSWRIPEWYNIGFYLSYFVDGDRTDWGCAAGRRRKGLYCRSGENSM